MYGCPECNNDFLEEDGFCVMCGQRHPVKKRKKGSVLSYAQLNPHSPDQQNSRSACIVSRPKQVPNAQQSGYCIRIFGSKDKYALDPNEMKAVLVETLDRIAQFVYVDVDKFEIKNTSRTAVDTKYTHDWSEITEICIRFGARRIAQHMHFGKQEYVNVAPFVPEVCGIQGWNAFRAVIAHEMAHVITRQKYGHFPRPHGKEWLSIYKQLIKIVLEDKDD